MRIIIYFGDFLKLPARTIVCLSLYWGTLVLENHHIVRLDLPFLTPSSLIATEVSGATSQDSAVPR